MRARHTLFGSLLVLGVTFIADAASAGSTAPISTLQALPRPVPLKPPEATTSVPGLSLKSKDGYSPGTRWHDLSAATGRGYCLASSDSGYRWMDEYGMSSASDAEELDLNRLVEKDGKVTLERTRVRFEPARASVIALGRSQVELHEVTRTSAGVVVWGYRDGHNVVVLARNVERGRESSKTSEPDTGVAPFVSADGCPYAAARLDVRKPETGTFAQLAGSLPSRGKGKEKVTPRFTIDASLSRVARDPEPILAVRVRVRD